MAKRPEGPGKDFDDMWNRHNREGRERAARGEGPYAMDAAIRRAGEMRQPEPTGPKHKANSDSCVVPLAFLGGLAWALSELAQRVV